MSVELANANVVIVAHQFNPSVIGQLWLVENQIVGRDDFRQGCVFTDLMVHVISREFALFVAPEQLQFVPLVPIEEQQSLISLRLGHLIETLPHTPYSAVGLNFTWHVRPESADMGSFSRRMFFAESKSLFQAFDVEDARFGGYLSKNALGGRLKLDVKPVTTGSENDRQELMQFAFNLHGDVGRSEKSVESIRQMLNCWDEARAETEKIMASVEGAQL